MFELKCVALLLCLTLSVLGTEAGKVSFIKPCKYKDSACLLESAQKAKPYFIDAIPEFGIAALEPFIIEKINGDSGLLKLRYEDVIVKRLKECKLNKIERPDKLTLYVELICPMLVIGNYTTKGKLGTFDVYGNGGFEIGTDEAKLAVTIHLEVFKKDGIEYYKFQSFTFNYEALKKVHYKFDGLCPGDKATADLIIEFLNNNWKETIDAYGSSFIMEIITKMVTRIGKCISEIPCNELELD